MSLANADTLYRQLADATHAQLSGAATADDVLLLERLLESDPAAPQLYIDCINEAVFLRDWAGSRVQEKAVSGQRSADRQRGADSGERLADSKSEELFADRRPGLANSYPQTASRSPQSEIRNQKSEIPPLTPHPSPLTPSSRNPHSSSLLRRPFAFSVVAATVIISSLLLTMAQIPFSREAGTKVAVKSGGMQIPPVVYAARWTDGHECVWQVEQEHERPMPGDRFEPGQVLNLSEGLAELTFTSGSKVVVEGPAEIRVASDNAIHLDQGKLSANVPQAAVGFTVDTPSGKVVDLGTEFGVEVTENGDVTVQVFKGEVLVDSAARNNDSNADPKIVPSDLAADHQVKLSANESVRVSAANRRIASVENSGIRFPEMPRRFVRKKGGVAIQFDFGDSWGVYYGTNAPAHADGTLSYSDLYWNAITGDAGEGLKFSNGKEADAVRIDLGISPRYAADADIDWNLKPMPSDQTALRVSPATEMGVLDTEMGRDSIWINENRTIGARVCGLPAGTYRVYLIARGNLNRERNYSYRAAIGVNIANFSDDQPKIGPNEKPFQWTNGKNYFAETVTVAGPDDWITAIQANLENEEPVSLILGVQIVQVETQGVK